MDPITDPPPQYELHGSGPSAPPYAYYFKQIPTIYPYGIPPYSYGDPTNQFSVLGLPISQDVGTSDIQTVQPGHPCQPPQIVANAKELKYRKMNLHYGVLSVVLGAIIMIIDPLLPSIFLYPYSIFPGGFLMVISGICSIKSSRSNNDSFLKVSLVFNIVALMNIFIGYALGLANVASNYPKASNSVIYSLGIFNTVYEIMLFIFLLWDSSLKCGTLCCRKKIRPVVISTTIMVDPGR